MFKKLINLWRGQPIAVTLFILALSVTLFFGFRMVAFAIYWADPAHRDQELLGWMTPRYVAHSWRVPPEVLGNALSLRPGEGRPLTLAEIAAQKGVSLAELIAQINLAIDTERQNQK